MSSYRKCIHCRSTDDSVVEHIKIYRYGKLHIPGQLHIKRGKHRRDARFTKGPLTCDRAALIAKIHHLLDIHRTQRQRNVMRNSKCLSDIHREIQKAIRNCFDEKIFDSKLYPVGDLFLELFKCNGNSYAIFSPLMGDHVSCTSHLMNNGVNILYPKHAGSDDNVAFEYYLHHVSNLRDEEYEWNHGTFLDLVNQEIDHYSGQTPLSAAVQKRDPYLVLILLRYGADPFQRTAETAVIEEREWSPTEQLIDDLNGLCLFKNTGFSPETRDKLASEEAKVLQCLSYFRRAVPFINLNSSNHVITVSDDDTEDENTPNVPKSVPSRVYNLLPSIAASFDMNFFKPTASLKHLCRCAIRHRLQENRHRITSLPRGISLLPLPKQLKDYVDLQTD